LRSQRRPGFKAFLPLVATLAALALGGCGLGRQSTLSPAGPVAQAQLSMLYESLAIMSAIFIVVLGVFLYSIIRFRARKTDRELPKQVHGSTALEIVWTIIPIVIIAILSVTTVHYAFALGTPQHGKGTVQVQVIGHQYWWEFRYPGTGVVTANVLHIPVGEKVDFSLQSADVIHSFWVPELGGKTDLIPGRTNFLWLEASKPGTYYGQCAQLCGPGHAYMKFSVVAESPAAYRSWLSHMEHDTVSATTLAEQAGLQLFKQDCATCHTIQGTPFAGKVGPNLTALMERPTIAAGTLPNTTQGLSTWLHDPPAVKPGARMPDLGLSQSQIRSLIAFLETLK
jgi:cytochrome c oxidase subunit 2